jgi:hypothetical protein
MRPRADPRGRVVLRRPRGFSCPRGGCDSRSCPGFRHRRRVPRRSHKWAKSSVDFGKLFGARLLEDGEVVAIRPWARGYHTRRAANYIEPRSAPRICYFGSENHPARLLRPAARSRCAASPGRAGRDGWSRRSGRRCDSLRDARIPPRPGVSGAHSSRVSFQRSIRGCGFDQRRLAVGPRARGASRQTTCTRKAVTGRRAGDEDSHDRDRRPNQ